MENILKLYTYVDGVNDTPFPSEEEQVQIIDFKFDASRMAGAPTIEATVKHRLCLDNLWSDKVYASYRGEKYYVRNTPSSSKDNTDGRYSHDVELMSERDVLNHVYFIDAVQGDSGIDKVKSNSPSVQFYGDIKEFVGRLNSSLEYAKLDYTAVIDDGIESEIVNVSFEDKYILEALQESVNIFEIPYYFVSKTIHFGYMENAIPYEMEYGNEGALLSISKENANYKAVNRVSGTGSTENIPYYYPNTSPNGDIYCEPITGNTGITSSSDITVINPELFASKISVNDILTCFLFDAAITSNKAKSTIEGIEVVKIDEVVDLKINVSSPGYVSLNISYLPNIVIDSPLLFTYTSNPKVTLASSSVDVLSFDTDTITFMAKEAGEYSVHFETTTTLITDKYMELKVTVDVSIKGLGFQLVKEGNVVEVYNEKEVGLSFNKQPNSGDKIKQSVKALIPFSQTLMPPVYRETSGAERFYNAKNNTYEIPVEGGYYNFENEYSDNNRKEIIVDFSEIKPSIVGMTNKEGLRIDMFSEFAFDKNDSDEYDSVNNEYLHPYFYGKLRKFDGDYGFNLFDHAQEGSTMTVAMTSGVCGGCNFEIGVGEETGKNIIQVDGNGDLIYGEDGKVKTGEPQEKQNDTRTNEVWIALKKDDTTYPSFKPMPNATGNLKPSTGDTFVLTGINMPQSYIEKAENDLKEAIIKYMWLNNTDKFNFSIKFSRIFLKEHPEILDKLNENARIVVKYSNSTYTFYVDNFSVNVNSSEPLPEIDVNLVDTLTIGKNSLQNALDSVKQDILSTIGGADFLKQGLKYFIRKDVDDYANGKLKLKKGASFGSYEKGKKGSNIDEKGYSEFEEVTSREGIKSSNLLWGALGAGFGLVTKDSTGNSYLEIDKLLVRMKAVFNQLEIRELSYSGGNFIFSPAGMKCTRVVETGNVYRCFFTADDGEVAVNNTFKVDDLVRMQEINIKEGVHEGISNRYFWRRCVGVGDNYIDLSMTDRDMTSDDAPKAGDSLVTLGNKTQVDRQNAIVISVFGEGSPSFIQYKGINDYTLDGKAVTTISPNGNVFTGDFIMKSGNKVEDELDKTNQSVDQAIQDMADTINLVKELEQNVGNLQDQIDGVIETWFYDPVPTLSNEPAVNWTTDNDKNNHLGDLYFDKDGKTYRFENRDGVYQWTVIPDTGLEEALRKAQQAQDTADGKRRIFTTQPTTESTYDVGDLWVNATAGGFTNDILRCKVAKTSGQAFSLSHWELASKYTDDTKANEAMQNAQEAQEAADAAQAAADKAQTYATNAKNAADAAQSSANEANSLLSDIANDNKLTAQEKQQTKKEWDIIVSEKPLNDASADKFGVSKTEYTNAYNALSTYITPLLQSLTTTSDIVGSTFRATFKNYYDARTELLNNISAKAKELADAAQSTADVAQENADAAKKAADKALAKAESAQSAADAAQSTADAAATAASNAQNTANTAKTTAEAANSELNKINSDGYISPSEKGALVQQHKDIQSEYADIISQANKYGVSTASYTTAYNSANTALTKYTATSPTHIEVGADYANISAYYTARQTILDAISTAAKKVATDAQADADAAKDAAEQAKQDAAQAQATANDAKADAAAAKSAADAANAAISDLEANIEGAFADGIISEAEAIAISKYTNQVNESFTSINATYTEVYGNVYLEGTAKTNLKTKYDALVTKKNALLNAISTAIADGKATQAESQAVDSAFSAYNSTVNSYQTALEQANEAIQTKIKSYADAAQESVDNLQIGGTNLLVGTSSEESEIIFNANSTPSVYRGNSGDFNPLSDYGLKGGDTISYAATITVGENTYMLGLGIARDGESTLYPVSKVTNSGDRASIIYTLPANATKIWLFAKIYPANTEKIVGTKKEVKLEKGNKPTDWSPAPEDVQSDIDAAMQEAAEAKAAADTAKIEANEANDRLNSWASDSVISPTEKQAIKNEQAQVRAEKNEIVADAGKYSIATTTYVNAFTAYDAVLTKYSASSPENITIGTDFNSTQTTYYSERTKILGLIADGAKKYVDDIEVGGRNLAIYSTCVPNNVTISGYTFRQITADTRPTFVLQIQTFLGSTLLESASFGSMVIGRKSFVINPTKKFNRLRIKANGATIDTGVIFINDLFKENDKYIITIDFVNITQGSFEFKDVMIVRGDKSTDFTPSPEDVDANLEQYKTEVTSQFERTDERISQSVTETKTYTDSAIGNIKIGSVNLISKKMMLAWNEKNKDIAVWGQDADGVYLGINQSFLYNAFRVDGVSQDIFSNKIKYKANTQYVLSVKWKLASRQNYEGLIIVIKYTDGSSNSIILGKSQTSIIRKNLISSKDKTIKKIIVTYGTYTSRSLIYAISLIEGNQIPTEIPEAVEDITGQSNVNLVDGGKELVINKSDNIYNSKSLKIPLLKPNTVYSLIIGKIDVIDGNTDVFTAVMHVDGNAVSGYLTFDISKRGGLIITNNSFSAKKGLIYLYAGKEGHTQGISIKYSDIMLVEGFVPPGSYSGSENDAATIAMEKTITGINNTPGLLELYATQEQYNSQQELIGQVDSRITVQAGRIDSVVSDISGLNTRISQTESDIELKVDASGIISAINLSKEGVAIKGDRIEITGQTVFKDSNGNKLNIFGQGDKVLTINNGVFSVDEKGLINASAGKIAGFEIDEDNFRIKANSVVNGESVEMYLSNYKFYMGSSKRSVIMGVLDGGTGYGKNTVLVADSGDIYQQGVVQEGTSSRHCRFYTSDLYLRMMSSHRQQLNGTWCPVVYPLAAGQQYVGDIESNTNVAINIGKNVGTANYAVVGSWYTTAGGTANNNVLFVVTRKSTTDFTIAVTETRGTKQSVYFMWALFPI